MERLKIKKNDPVVVVSGKRGDKGKVTRVLRIIPKKGRLVAEKIQLIKEYVRANPQKNIKGGIVEREGTIPVNHVMYYCKECEQGVRIAYQENPDGKRRICRKCGVALD